jgi:hypothetical protein
MNYTRQALADLKTLSEGCSQHGLSKSAEITNLLIKLLHQGKKYILSNGGYTIASSKQDVQVNEQSSIELPTDGEPLVLEYGHDKDHPGFFPPSGSPKRILLACERSLVPLPLQREMGLLRTHANDKGIYKGTILV